MPSTFPGMDPYLEEPDVWPGVHAAMIGVMRALLGRPLRPHYFADIEQRLIVEAENEEEADESTPAGSPVLVPDATVLERASTPAPQAGGGVAELDEAPVRQATYPYDLRQRSLVIRSVADRRVVTIIELLSPVNKRPGRGRRVYLAKRDQVMDADVNLVEIDLQRGGVSPLTDTAIEVPASDYLVHISAWWARPMGHLWPIDLRERLPEIPIPLDPQVKMVRLDLQAAVDRVYDEGNYDLVLRYGQRLSTPLNAEDAAWAARQAPA